LHIAHFILFDNKMNHHRSTEFTPFIHHLPLALICSPAPLRDIMQMERHGKTQKAD